MLFGWHKNCLSIWSKWILDNDYSQDIILYMYNWKVHQKIYMGIIKKKKKSLAKLWTFFCKSWLNQVDASSPPQLSIWRIFYNIIKEKENVFIKSITLFVIFANTKLRVGLWMKYCLLWCGTLLLFTLQNHCYHLLFGTIVIFYFFGLLFLMGCTCWLLRLS